MRYSSATTATTWGKHTMSTHKHIDLICTIVTICALLITVLFMNGEALGITKIVDEDAEGYEGTEYFTANDLDDGWDDSSATVITLNGDSATVSGNGAYAYDGGAVISNAGNYVVSGTLTDGSLTVDAYQSSKVWIKLAGVNIHCEDDAAIRINQAEKVFLTLEEGTENVITSGAVYTEAALSDNAGGAVFSHDDLTVNGSGALHVSASYKHGFDCNDSLHITGGTITVSAPEDGLHVNDSVRIADCSLTVNAGDDGIRCDKEITVVSGTVLVAECHEGLEAPEITVEDGTIEVYPTDDGFNANGGTDGTYEGTPFIRMNGGDVLIVNKTATDADGLDSNGDIYINGGNLRISLPGNGTNSAIDYPSGSGICEITGGTVIACGASSMAERFGEGSTQPSVLYRSDAVVADGTVLRLADENGTVLLSWHVPCGFSAANLSCPELVQGKTCTITIGEKKEEVKP